MVVRCLYSGNVMINDYVVPAGKCRDIPMVVRRLYSGNVIVNDYVVPPDDNWYISTFNSQDYVIIHYNIAIIDAGRPLVYLYILLPGLRNH
jgi:hypothetical protein